jgi:hypothetical protein
MGDFSSPACNINFSCLRTTVTGPLHVRAFLVQRQAERPGLRLAPPSALGCPKFNHFPAAQNIGYFVEF